MYLEETIEALEVQEDSGFSNDEPEPGHLTEKMDQRRGEGKYKQLLMSLNILFCAFLSWLYALYILPAHFLLKSSN